jgi:hypothetical protein
VAFLRAIGHKELKAVLGGTGSHLQIIPTTEGVLRACSVTYFNDLGPHAGEVPLPPGYSVASDYVDRRLAEKLGLPFLSERIGMLDGDNFMEMKEDLTTRISNVLVSYTKEQAFTEFLANAADAGATEFGVTLDVIQHTLPEIYQFVSPSLRELCGQPSLILHNNGVFSPSDWKGICSVGTGSKQGASDGNLKIGRFGLGALSMFYFTEVLLTSTLEECVCISHNFKVAMILSGSYVLFMDPGKTHLGKVHLGKDRSCYPVSLEAMKRYVNFTSGCTLYNFHDTRFFPAHLSLLHGHYGFDHTMDEYHGV